MKQLSIAMPFEVPAGAYQYGQRSSGEVHGVVLTKPHVVELILELAGYSVTRDLDTLSLLEPACGEGAFLANAVDRLMKSAKIHDRSIEDLADAIVAYDVDPQHVNLSRDVIAGILRNHGTTCARAKDLAAHWVKTGDFLLAGKGQFDFVVGNPPYIRIEKLAPELQAEYRRRYVSLYDRADLYVAFIERSLELLKKDGMLSFICSDRWTLNRYGAPLRRLIADRFSVRFYVDLHQASPFESSVIAYPSIFGIANRSQEKVKLARLKTASADECRMVPVKFNKPTSKRNGIEIATYVSWFTGDEPWVLSSPEQTEALRNLESRFGAIESDGQTRVGIGVATGADAVYIVDKDADIEPDRLVPLIMRDDIDRGTIKDAHRSVINTFDNAGRVVDLDSYPRLRNYLLSHHVVVGNRHVAKVNKAGWFRTIDRVYPELVKKPKLLIPDIAGSNEVAYDHGRYHPHHNLYFVTSTVWDLEVLGGLLSSKVALFFVWSYAVKMRGGYLRFQAQYLRRIRVPNPSELPTQLANELRKAFKKRDFKSCDNLAMKAYGLSKLPSFDFVDTRT